MIDKTPPQSIETECHILGAILIDANAIERTIDILPTEAFYAPTHKEIYHAAIDLYQKEIIVDFITVSNWLEEHKLLEKVGGKTYLTQLRDTAVSSANVDGYAKLVLSKYKRRQFIAAGMEIVEQSYDMMNELDVVLEKAEGKIFEITQHQTDRFKPQTIDECFADVWNKIQQGESPTISTGIQSLDKFTGGMLLKDLIVVAARASMGKTWLGCHLANHVAANLALPVVFFSAESSKEQIIKRFLSIHSGIDSQRLIHNKIYKSELATLEEALGVVKQLPIIIDDTPAELQTIARMRSNLRRIRSQHGRIGLIVMDYIQKLGDRAAGNRAQTIGKYSGAFKDMAKEFDCPFVALAQINRGVEGQHNKRPGMADIKDSGDIEQDMDLGLFLYRDEYYESQTKNKGLMEIHVAKNRNGPTGTCQVVFEPAVGRFSDKI